MIDIDIQGTVEGISNAFIRIVIAASGNPVQHRHILRHMTGSEGNRFIDISPSAGGKTFLVVAFHSRRRLGSTGIRILDIIAVAGYMAV